MNACREINTQLLVDAITEDAIMTLEVCGPEDSSQTNRSKRCLEIISREFDAQENSAQALEEIKKWESDNVNDRPFGTSSTDTLENDTLALAMEFFKASVTVENAEERAELYAAMQSIADYVEIKQWAAEEK